MKPEIGQLNIYFDKDSVTTSESQQILNLVNVALGLASIDLIKEKNESKYESLKFSFYSYLYGRNKELAESVFESFLPSYDYDRNYLFERIDRLRYRLKDKIKEPYYEELLFLLEESYFDRKHRISNYSRRELQGRVIAELVENNSFEKRSFNTYDFSEWLNLETENRVSEIGLATTENSLEYEIKFLIILGLQNHDLLKDMTLLAFDYILALLKKPNESNNKLVVPEMPDNMTTLLSQYEKVDFEINGKKGTMKLKLRKRV